MWYPVLSDRPTEIHNPKRKVRLVASLFALAIMVWTVTGSYIAAAIATHRADNRNQQLAREIDQRSKARNAEARQLQAAIDQYRRDWCVVVGRLPHSPDVDEIKARYHCADVPEPSASPGASASTGGSTPAQPGMVPRSRSAGTSAHIAPSRSATPQPVPAPPPPAPQPGPQQPPPVAPSSLCLPLLEICL